MTCGNLVQTSHLIGVPRATLSIWRKQPWWVEQIEDFQADDNMELDARFQKIIRKALDVVSERLDNGNFQMDQKTGRIVRIPVSMGESHRVMSDLVSRQQEIRAKKAVEHQAHETVNEKLVNLAKHFADMALQVSGKKPQVYDMEEEIEVLPASIEAPQASEDLGLIPEVHQTP